MSVPEDSLFARGGRGSVVDQVLIVAGAEIIVGEIWRESCADEKKRRAEDLQGGEDKKRKKGGRIRGKRHEDHAPCPRRPQETATGRYAPPRKGGSRPFRGESPSPTTVE